MSRTKNKTGLTLDFGGSSTRGVAHYQEERSVLVIEPQVIAVPKASLADKTQNNLCNAAPENIVWVGVGEDYRAVGYLAKLFDAPPSLRPRKYELAVYKTLAAVWVMKQKFKLSSAFDLSLALLLPPGEYEDSYLLEPMLVEALAGFDTPTGQLQVNLRSYSCFPEGGGIYAMYCKQKLEDIKRWNLGIVQIGYRNASVLVSKRGILERGKTSNLGMAKMVEKVISHTSGLTPEVLATAIAQAGSNPQPHHFIKLVGISDLQQRSVQVQNIVAAVEAARIEYTIALVSWLLEALPPLNELSGIIFCGGTADYMKIELEEAFKRTTVLWHGLLTVPPELDKWELNNRLADVWCLSEYHHNSMKARKKGNSPKLATVSQQI